MEAKKNMNKINEYFNFNNTPFINNEDDIYESYDYSQIKARIEFLLDNEEIGLITGFHGAGKTSIINKIFKDKNIKTIYLSVTDMSLFDFYVYIGQALDVNTNHCHKLRIIKDIEYSIRNSKDNTILILDDVEEIDIKILKLIKSLSEVKGLHIILIGHTSFRSALKDTRKSFIESHIITNYECKGLSLNELKEYIKWNLNKVNYNEVLVDDRYYRSIHEITDGSIQVINKFMSNLLLIMTINNTKQVTSKLIEDTKDEMEI